MQSNMISRVFHFCAIVSDMVHCPSLAIALQGASQRDVNERIIAALAVLYHKSMDPAKKKALL
jgi:hypothetical protein